MKQTQSTITRVALSAFALGAGLVVYPVTTAKSAPDQPGTGGNSRPAPRNQAGRRGPGRPGGPGGDSGDNGPPPGPPPCGPRPEELGDVLHLSADQQAKIKTVMDKQRTEMRRIQEATRQAINGILTPAQNQQLRQIHDDSCPPPPDGGPPPGDGNGPPPDDGNGPPPR